MKDEVAIYDGIITIPPISGDIYDSIRDPKERVRYFRDSMLRSRDVFNATCSEFSRYNVKMPVWICLYRNVKDEDMYEDNCMCFNCPRMEHDEDELCIEDQISNNSVSLFWNEIVDVSKKQSSKGSNSEHYIIYYEDHGVKKMSLIICTTVGLDISAWEDYRTRKNNSDNRKII